MMNNLAIEVKNLTKIYKLYDKPIDRLKEALHPLKKIYHKDFYALNDVSFDIKKGETVGIIGKNGAGKSTLLKIITGVLTQSSGKVKVNGKISSLLELGAGFNPEYTGVENIYLQGTLIGYTKEQMDDKIDEILAFADIGEFVSQPVKSYSSGMFARLAFSVAINVEPDILIIDEALSVGDIFFQQKCNKFMQDKMAGVTKILVTHDMSTIANMTDRALLISNGKIIFNGDPLDAIEVYQKKVHNEVFKTKDIIKEKTKKITNEHIKKEYKTIEKEKLAGSMEAKIEKFNIGINKKDDKSFIYPEDNLDISIIVKTNEDIKNIIVGYIFKDKYGNSIFGENTITSQCKIKDLYKNSTYKIDFSIIWPEIQENDYFLTIGLGKGENALEHTIMCWAHNICTIKSLLKGGKIVHCLFNNKIENIKIKEIE